MGSLEWTTHKRWNGGTLHDAKIESGTLRIGRSTGDSYLGIWFQPAGLTPKRREKKFRWVGVNAPTVAAAKAKAEALVERGEV